MKNVDLHCRTYIKKLIHIEDIHENRLIYIEDIHENRLIYIEDIHEKC